MAPRSRKSFAASLLPRFFPRVELLEDRTLLTADPLSAQFHAGLLSLQGDNAQPVTVATTSGDFIQLTVAGQRYSSNPAATNYDSGLAGATGRTLQTIQLNGNAGQDQLVLGNLDVAGGLTVESDGVVNVQGQLSAGGSIQLSGSNVLLSGQVKADGAVGGMITVNATNVLQSGLLQADGSQGGGSIQVDFTGRYVATAGSVTAANSTGRGSAGNVMIDGGATGTLFTSGKVQATANTGGQGGTIALFGEQLQLVGASINASGRDGGGWIRVGGDSPSDIAAHGGFTAGISDANTTTVDATTTLTANALQNGNGGRVVVWSQDTTNFGGTLQAHGAGSAGQGGLLEVSSAGTLNYGGHASATASSGHAGQLLLDPANLVINNNAGVAQFNLVGPDTLTNNDTFGSSMVTLSNGNVVVTDPNDSTIAANAGAVFVFNGATGALLGELTGSTAGDEVGSGGVTALTNGNFVVSSPSWQNAGVAVGAATWMNGNGGAATAVSAGNSIIGSTAGDTVGSGGIVALVGGNYVVISPFWQSGGNQVGAVTWGNGVIGSSGAITANNSLVGATAGDWIGIQGVTPLSNGNYVVSSPDWQTGGVDVGAATWGNGLGGTVGPVSATNSLVGEANEGNIAGSGVTALTNGNYVVVSPGWDNGAGTSDGAVTWGNGFSGTVGQVLPANSVIGVSDWDQVGAGGVTALANGSFVISSPFWNGNIGAVTWEPGDGSAVNLTVTAANSLIGSTAFDEVGGGGGGVTALSNGNYVVASPSWNNNTGAATWGDGTSGTTGVVSISNSLVGSTIGDLVGFGNGNPGSGAIALSDGNYVVVSPSWNDSLGAVTWGSGSTGVTGTINSTNSLVGATANDQVGSGGVTALSGAAYVVSSPFWQSSGNAVGAVTLGKADGGTVGAVGSGNSLVGATAGDDVGSGGVTVLAGGNYVVSSPDWQQSGNPVGAATFVNGTTGQTAGGAGTIDAANSLIGSGAAGVALNQIVGLPGGNAFLVNFRGGGGSVVEVQTAPTSESYATAATQDLTLAPSFITATLDTGTAVTLQASNDVIVESAIIVNAPSGTGGDLTITAGRQVLIHADITTDNGNLTIISNDTAADGVVNSQRLGGGATAAVSMSAGTALNAGTGNITILLSNGAGNTNFAADDLTLGDMTGHNIYLANNGQGDESIGGTQDGGGVDMGTVSASGSLTAVSSDDISQAGSLTPGDPDTLNVAGITSLTAAGPILLTTAGNVFAKAVTFSDPGDDVIIDATGDLTLNSQGAATLSVATTGIFTGGDHFLVAGASSFAAGTIVLDGFESELQGPVSLNSGGDVTVDVDTPLTLNNLTFAGSASFTAPGVTVVGTLNVGSQQTLTMDSGSPAVLAGTTTLAGGTIADSDGLVVAPGGTLSGYGTLQVGAGASGVSTQIGATLAPAMTNGGLTIDGDLTLAPVSLLQEQLQSNTAFSQLNVTGAVTLNNPTLQVTFVNPYVPTTNDQFQIVTDGPGPAVSGKFAQGSTFTIGSTQLGLAYSNNVMLTVALTPGAPDIAVPGTQSFVANQALTISGISVSEPAIQNPGGMVVQATLSVQNGTITLPNMPPSSFFVSVSLGSQSITFTGMLAFVNLALSQVVYHPAQDSVASDTLSVTINDLGNTGAPAQSSTQTVNVAASSGTVAVVADPVLAGKKDLVIQGTTAGGDTITVVPAKAANSYVVTLNGAPQTVTGVNGRILVFDPNGNNTVTLSSTVKLPTFLVAGNGNNKVTGGAGNDTITAGTGNDTIDGGAGSNTLIESGDVDFTLVGGTSTKNGTLTKGPAEDILVDNHIQKVKLSLTGSDPHTINAAAFAGPETLMASAGNDTLLAGNGNDVLVGGSGDDSLQAGSGMDLLIAGTGTSTLAGGKNQDLMIGGSTTYDANVAALSAIMAEWSSATIPYATKIKQLLGTQAGGLNGSVKLNGSTVINSHTADSLTTGSGQDWFWWNSLGSINNRSNETVTTIH